MNEEKVVCTNGVVAKVPAEPVTRFSINGKVEQLTPFPGTGLENIKVEGLQM